MSTQSHMPSADWVRRIASTLAVVSLAAFVALNLAFVVSRGVCCGDDAFSAVVAKNLASGSGYATSLGFDRPYFVLEPFDAHITTGPPLVLPVSAMIRLLGNRFWVPGTVQVALWTLLLVATWRALLPVASGARRATVGIAFLWVSYAVSPDHLEHWYAMLGEVPAALAILLGLAIWAVDPGSRRRSFIAAVLWSLAVLTKVLAVIYAAPCLLAAVVVGSLDGRHAKRRCGVFVPLAVGFLLPILAFEAWKGASLGLEGYLAQLRSLESLILTYGMKRTGFVPAEITVRLIAFYTGFGVSLPGLLVLTAFGGSLAWRTAGAVFRRLYLVLLAGVVVHTGYWLLFSIGLPRYFLIGVVLLSALLTIPCLALRRGAPALLYSGALALSLVGAVGRVQYPISILQGEWSASPPTRSNRESVVSFLDARLDRRPFIGQWWASVADLEYLSKGVLDFKGYAALRAKELSRGVLVVTNGRFDDTGDKAFSSLVAGCGRPVLAAAPYAVHECGGRQVAR
jgi:hypothetical protein